MTPALTIALSGLNAQSLRLAATASNVAHAGTSGAAPGSTSVTAGNVVYRPLRVDIESQKLPNGEGVGVRAHIRQEENGFYHVYAPEQAGADQMGMVAVPAVDITQEMAHLIEIKALFKANAAVLRQQAEMTGRLLDLFE